ncbi:stress-induced protein YchH [Serratia microhaemolytica]|uniref:stress-induced protein YchH n=1 Tax=Serratia microhaemolytica TaxID=2675110 RepID=UPI000FDF4137|nr:stress-induced protein YchH [Serratia microhaemolytica]
MKHKNAKLIGNTLMIFGIVVMLAGGGYAIIAEMSPFNLPQLFAHGAVMSIFIGALLWLAGACVSGREGVAERYWWIKHFNKHNKSMGSH